MKPLLDHRHATITRTENDRSVMELVRFRSGDAFVGFVRDNWRKHGEFLAWHASQDNMPKLGKAFNRTNSMDEALEAYWSGWRKGLERATPYNDAIQRVAQNMVTTNRLKSDLQGHIINVPSYLRGEPEHMRRLRRGQSRTRSVRISVDLNVRCDACGRRWHDAQPTPPNALLVRGVLAWQLYNAMVRAKLRPILEGFTVTQGRRFSEGRLPVRTTVITLAEPGMVVAPGRLLFALAHEDFVRRFDFYTQELLSTAAHPKFQGIVKEHMGYLKGDKRKTRVDSHGRGAIEHPAGYVPLGGEPWLYTQTSYEYGDLVFPPVYDPYASGSADWRRTSGPMTEAVLGAPRHGVVSPEWAASILKNAGVRISA